MVFELIAAGIFGLIYGSFLNVVILRFDDWLAIVNHPSHCPNCQTPLKWYDLIPVFSWLFLRGRCRYCQQPISWQYPVVEIATGLLFTGAYYLIFLTGTLPLWRELIVAASFIVGLGALMTILFHDLYEMMIPDLMANILLATGLIFGWSLTGSIFQTLLGGFIGFAPIALLVYPSRGKWMGEGDVKIAAGLGLMLGYPNIIVGLIAAFLAGGIYGAIALGLKAVKLRSAVPFGPFLISGGLIALFFGTALISWYLGTIGYGYY